MLKRTHEAFSGVFWLGGTLCVNLAAYRAGYEIPVNGLVALLGLPLAVPFSAGKNSPDIDHIWAPGPPRQNYHWKFHRGFTHRFWFASLVILPPFILLAQFLSGIIAMVLLPLCFAPPSGWVSHLFGDMIYGKLKILGKRVGLGWTTGGLSETGKRKNGGSRFVIDPAAKFCTFMTVVLAACHLFMFASTLGLS